MSEKAYVIVPTMTGTADDATVTFINATFQVKNKSEKRYPAPDFGSWLVEQISDVNKLLAESYRLFFKKKFYCPSCSTELNPNLRKPVETVYELKFHDFDPFTLKITCPSVECPKCRKTCGISTKGPPGSKVYEAILNAFAAENIKP